jgi:hypothetical protein
LRARRVRAGPALPSYLALLHAGFSVPRMSPPGRWALTPPFHPCQMRSTETGGLPVFPKACRRGASITGGLFSVALSVAAALECAFAHPSTQPPGVTRRVALPWPALASSPQLESGLSSRSPRLHGTNRLTRRRNYTMTGARLQSLTPIAIQPRMTQTRAVQPALRRSAARGPRGSACTEELLELVFVQDWYLKGSSLLKFRSGIRADHHVVGFLAHRGTWFAAVRGHQCFGFLA